MSRTRLVAVVLSLGLAAPTAALAQKVPGPEPEAHREEGAYSGARPGTPAGKGAQPRGKAGTVTWVGFEVHNGTGRVFVQSPAAFTATQRIEGNAIVVRLDGVKALARNVRRPLLTQWFDTPVARVSVQRVSARKASRGQPARKAGYELRIDLKDGVAPREAALRTATEADGFFYLYAEL